MDVNLEVVDETAGSLTGHLGAMESEDLLQLAELLRDLRSHPGWERLAGLVRVHAEHVKGASTRMLWARLAAAQSAPDAPVMYATAGRVRGMAEVAQVVNRVLVAADAVQAQLEREDSSG